MVGLATTILLEFPLCVTLFFLFEPFALTLYIHHGRKEAKSAQGLYPWTPENGQKDSGLWLVIPAHRPVWLGLCGPCPSLLNGFWSVPYGWVPAAVVTMAPWLAAPT